MGKIINIGRNQGNDLVLNFQQVSGTHAKITLIGSNSLIIEDLGSSNGTFVNGIQIRRKIVSRVDRVKIANILLDTSKYFPSLPGPVHSKKSQNIKSVSDNDIDVAAEFKKLERVWNEYQNIKLNNKKKGFWKNIGMSVAGLGAGAILTLATGGMGGAMAIGSLLGRGAGGLLKDDEKLQVVENEFKVNYVCPKCKTFLGNIPYEGLVQIGQCKSCKTNWLK